MIKIRCMTACYIAITGSYINVMPEAGGGGPRDEMGTLNVLAHPMWGILANCWSRDPEANRVLNAVSLDTNVSPSWRYPEFPEVQTKGI